MKNGKTSASHNAGWNNTTERPKVEHSRNGDATIALKREWAIHIVGFCVVSLADGASAWTPSQERNQTPTHEPGERKKHVQSIQAPQA